MQDWDNLAHFVKCHAKYDPNTWFMLSQSSTLSYILTYIMVFNYFYTIINICKLCTMLSLKLSYTLHSSLDLEIIAVISNYFHPVELKDNAVQILAWDSHLSTYHKSSTGNINKGKLEYLSRLCWFIYLYREQSVNPFNRKVIILSVD